MEHLHPALDDDNHIKMLLYDNDLFHDKKQSKYTNVHTKRFSEPNSLNRKKNPFKPVCFLYIDSLIITLPVVN